MRPGCDPKGMPEITRSLPLKHGSNWGLQVVLCLMHWQEMNYILNEHVYSSVLAHD